MSTAARRGRPKKLELDTIVDTALAVLDADGIDAVSFRRVGAELGVSHMTLYTYFDSKESLLNAMVARTLSLPSSSPTRRARGRSGCAGRSSKHTWRSSRGLGSPSCS